jgi:hypothetical protein
MGRSQISEQFASMPDSALRSLWNFRFVICLELGTSSLGFGVDHESPLRARWDIMKQALGKAGDL